MRGLKEVTLVLALALVNNLSAHAMSGEQSENGLRWECREELPAPLAKRGRAARRDGLLNFLEARFRGMIPPYSEERCREWGYEPIELPEVPDGWMRSPFLELLGELNMTPEYERTLKAECRGEMSPNWQEMKLPALEHRMGSILEARREGWAARYSLKRCLEWGIVPPSTDRRAH